MSILCMGDSLTYGYGVPANSCWVSLLNKKSKNKVINRGINGDTTSLLLSRSDEDLLKLKPDYLLLLIGTNDILMGADIKRVFDNICFLLNNAAKNFITPIALSPLPIYSSMAEQRWSSFIDYNHVNKNLCLLSRLLHEFCVSNSLQNINLYEAFIKQIDNFDQLYIDGIHPDIRGHYLIFQEVIKLNIFSQ